MNVPSFVSVSAVLRRAKLTKRQRAVAEYVLEMTIGAGNQRCLIGSSIELGAACGLRRDVAVKALRDVIHMGIVVQEGSGFYFFQTDSGFWRGVEIRPATAAGELDKPVAGETDLTLVGQGDQRAASQAETTNGQGASTENDARGSEDDRKKAIRWEWRSEMLPAIRQLFGREKIDREGGTFCNWHKKSPRAFRYATEETKTCLAMSLASGDLIGNLGGFWWRLYEKERSKLAAEKKS
jgi:hypothetical protein